ncbi:MAG: NnrU family protein [Gammaproteobacteria bacterium]|nr:NnrU family protein [Gammaproteobacteria bacterium]
MSTFFLGLAVFFGVHSISLLALDWRDRAAAAMGLGAWRIVYSLISLAGFYLLVAGYAPARATTGLLYVTPPSFRYLAAVLMLPVITLVLASVLRGRIAARARHPLLLAAILWAVAHLLTHGSVAGVLLFGSFLVWSVATWVSLERRPARPPMGFRASAADDALAVAGGLALYALMVLWLHARLFGVAPLSLP